MGTQHDHDSAARETTRIIKLAPMTRYHLQIPAMATRTITPTIPAPIVVSFPELESEYRQGLSVGFDCSIDVHFP